MSDYASRLHQKLWLPAVEALQNKRHEREINSAECLFGEAGKKVPSEIADKIIGHLSFQDLNRLTSVNRATRTYVLQSSFPRYAEEVAKKKVHKSLYDLVHPDFQNRYKQLRSAECVIGSNIRIQKKRFGNKHPSLLLYEDRFGEVEKFSSVKCNVHVTPYFAWSSLNSKEKGFIIKRNKSRFKNITIADFRFFKNLQPDFGKLNKGDLAKIADVLAIKATRPSGRFFSQADVAALAEDAAKALNSPPPPAGE